MSDIQNEGLIAAIVGSITAIGGATYGVFKLFSKKNIEPDMEKIIEEKLIEKLKPYDDRLSALESDREYMNSMLNKVFKIISESQKAIAVNTEKTSHNTAGIEEIKGSIDKFSDKLETSIDRLEDRLYKLVTDGIKQNRQ